MWTGIAGLLVVAAYTTVGVLQILVWNPLAAAPGRSLEQINEEMAAAGESMGEPVVYGVVFIGVGLALTVLIGALLGRIKRAKTVVLLDLALLVLGVPAYWLASFPAGMSIADTFMTHGGDHAPWGGVLLKFSAGALVALPLIALLGRRRRSNAAA